jgi:hypothetical protein
MPLPRAPRTEPPEARAGGDAISKSAVPKNRSRTPTRLSARNIIAPTMGQTVLGAISYVYVLRL